MTATAEEKTYTHTEWLEALARARDEEEEAGLTPACHAATLKKIAAIEEAHSSSEFIPGWAMDFLTSVVPRSLEDLAESGQQDASTPELCQEVETLAIEVVELRRLVEHLYDVMRATAGAYLLAREDGPKAVSA